MVQLFEDKALVRPDRMPGPGARPPGASGPSRRCRVRRSRGASLTSTS